MSKITMGSPDIGSDEIDAVLATLKSGWISQGPKTASFERQLRSYTNSRTAVAMNNGTSTLYSALLALGIGAGDEVLVPNLTYLSSVSMILLVGAQPVLLDCDNTFNTPPELLKQNITSKTKAVMGVDMKGMPLDYDGYLEICEDYGLKFVADSAESLGAQYKTRPVGSIAPLHSFSFFANKNITSGEGGAVCVNDVSLDPILRSIRNQGQGDERYIHERFGGNFRYTDISASIASVQLQRLDSILSRKNSVCEFYNAEFLKLKEVKTPEVPSYVTQHSWYNYCVLFKNAAIRINVQKNLERNMVETRRSFPPMHTQPFMRSQNYRLSGNGENALDLYDRMLDLPCHHNLTKFDLEKIVQIIKQSIYD